MASAINPSTSRDGVPGPAVRRVAPLASALAGGTLFGFGLALSTMVRPEIVLGFLRFEDWGLLLVMGGGAGVALLAYQLAPRLLTRPLLGGSFTVRVAVLDRPTIVGAAIFGIDWGLCGVWPRPGDRRPGDRRVCAWVGHCGDRTGGAGAGDDEQGLTDGR